MAAGQKYDLRDRLEVIIENRKKDNNWYPAVPANTYIETPLSLENHRVIPLGGVANAQIVGCNEAGFFSSFTTDEYGFHNPKGIWSNLTNNSIYFLGDSFTQGDCVDHADGVVERIRRTHPNTVNLGSGGNGPLLELAGIREYVQKKKTAYVFWMFYEGNDLMDLRRDFSDALLRNYLDKDYSQNLLTRQSDINDIVKSYVEHRFKEKKEDFPKIFKHLRLAIWDLLHNGRDGGALSADEAVDMEIFERIIRTAKTEVESKGGKLVFVYLPEYYRYSGGEMCSWCKYRDEVIRRVKYLGIDIIDLEPVFGDQSDPLGLFPYRLKFHYNAEGYNLVANSIIQYLNK